LDGDDKISRDELLAVLHMMVGANISEEQLGSIADRTIHEADLDGDKQISFDEFVQALILNTGYNNNTHSRYNNLNLVTRMTNGCSNLFFIS
jgi:hypothetical protein